MLVGDIPAVDAVERDESVAIARDAVLPVSMTGCRGAWEHGFDAEHPRSNTRQRKPLQDNSFRALNVDGHEVHVGDAMRREDRIEGVRLDDHFVDFEASFPRCLRLG